MGEIRDVFMFATIFLVIILLLTILFYRAYQEDRYNEENDFWDDEDLNYLGLEEDLKNENDNDCKFIECNGSKE